jgi:transcriptional regulator with XRE-family HTH domain
MITPEQCRAARALLGWTQDNLAEAAHVGVVTIRNFEMQRTMPRHATLVVIRQTLEQAGIIFIDANGDGPGVRVKRKDEN